MANKHPSSPSHGHVQKHIGIQRVSKERLAEIEDWLRDCPELPAARVDFKPRKRVK